MVSELGNINRVIRLDVVGEAELGMTSVLKKMKKPIRHQLIESDTRVSTILKCKKQRSSLLMPFFAVIHVVKVLPL